MEGKKKCPICLLEERICTDFVDVDISLEAEEEIKTLLSRPKYFDIMKNIRRVDENDLGIMKISIAKLGGRLVRESFGCRECGKEILPSSESPSGTRDRSLHNCCGKKMIKVVIMLEGPDNSYGMKIKMKGVEFRVSETLSIKVLEGMIGLEEVQWKLVSYL